MSAKYLCVLSNAFTTFIHLITHKQTHTGERPHIYDVCWKQFTEPWPSSDTLHYACTF